MSRALRTHVATRHKRLLRKILGSWHVLRIDNCSVHSVRTIFDIGAAQALLARFSQQCLPSLLRAPRSKSSAYRPWWIHKPWIASRTIRILKGVQITTILTMHTASSAFINQISIQDSSLAWLTMVHTRAIWHFVEERFTFSVVTLGLLVVGPIMHLVYGQILQRTSIFLHFKIVCVAKSKLIENTCKFICWILFKILK